MPRDVFCRRSSLSVAERKFGPTDSDFAPAYVRYAQKDRWGRIDRVFVQFVDDSLNGHPLFAAPLHDEDQARIAAMASRRVMPIVGPGSSNYSADHGIQGKDAADRHACRMFFSAALKGCQPATDALAALGCAPLSTAKINRLMEAEGTGV